MDLDKVRAGLQDIENEQQATETPAEQPSLWDRLKNLPGEIVNAMGQESVVTSQGNLAAAQETSEMASHAANDAAQAVSNLGQNWQDFLHRGAELQAAYSPEAVQQANETGDYSAQSEAVYNAEDAGQAVTDSIRDLALSPVRYEAGKYINQYADAEGDDNQKWAQALERSNAGLEYFLTDADKLAKARDIEADTGIPAEAFLGDTKAFRQALDIYHYKQKVDAAGGDINDVWQKFPELQDVANMDAKAAALALHNLDNIRETRGIVDTFTHALEAGNKELEYHNLQWKILTGEATDNDKERAADLKASIENDRKELPTVIEDPVAAMVAGIAQSAPEMWQSMVEGARDASVAATAAMLAGAALGSAAGPLGTAGGALAGLTGGAATGFARSLIADATRRQLVTAAIQAGIQTGMFAGMWRPETGQRYADYKEMKDENGNPLLTDNQARGWAALGGAANAGIELANFGIITKALAGAPHAKRVFGDIIEQFGAGLTAREAFSNMLKDRAADIAKVTLSESGEEGLQSISDDLIHNQIEYSTGDTSNKVYSFGDIAGHAFMAFAQSLPSSLGFGLIGAGGGMVTRGIGITSGMRNRASFEARYGENARKTVTGTLMVERLQQAISQNDMKEKAPDVQRTILRGELKNTGYENSYIDTEIALEQEHGLDDLKKVAKAANISNEDLQTAIEEKGTIMVPTEQYAQSAASPELLQAVSYSQEADSIGRMHKDAKAVMEQVQTMQKKAVERQVDTVLNVINQYFPSEEEAKNDPQKAQVRDLATAAVFANPENPAQGWNAYRKEMQDKLDAILAPAMQALQDGMGKGGQILKTEDERGNETYVRATENAEWYRNFYKAFHRAPTKEELTQMAIALTTGDASAPKVAGFIPETEEEQQAMAEGKKEINYLQQAIATLDKIKPTMRKLNGVEMKLTEGLSPEAFSVYRTVSDQLKAFGGMPARAARVSAILTARHADIVAKLISEKTGKKYTALDYLRERYGFDAEGKYLDNGLHQNAGMLADEKLKEDEGKWQANLHDILSSIETKRTKMVSVMRTPLVLQLIGARDLPIAMRLSKIIKIRKDHSLMTEKVLAQIPRALTDPVFIFKSATIKGRVVVALDLQDEGGHNVVVPFSLNTTDKGIEMSVMASAYGKESAKWYTNNIVKGRTLYVNNKKAADFVHTAGLQLPLDKQVSDFFTPSIKTDEDLVKARNANPSMYQMAGYYGAKKLSSVLMDKLSEAQTMKQNGKDNQTVWDKTGWFEGTDGKWRFEIPDHLDKINLGAMQGGTTLGAVYDNPLLYRAYPWLKDIKVSFVNANKSEYSGAVVKGAHDEEIHLNTNASEEELKSILVHEVQHVIQREEGFAPGGNVKSARAAIDNMQEGALKQKLQARSDGYLYQSLAGEEEARAVEERAKTWQKYDDIEAQYKQARTQYDQLKQDGKIPKNLLDELDEYISLVGKGDKTDADFDRMDALLEDFDKLSDNSIEYKAFKAADAVAKGRTELVNAWNKTYSSISDLTDVPGIHQPGAIITIGHYAVDRIVSPEVYAQSAWHGSPHVFDRFDLGAIGTGEGAQAHGWGLYFAKDHRVSKGYRERLSGFDAESIEPGYVVNLDGTKYIYNNNETVTEAETGTVVSSKPVYQLVRMLVQQDKDEVSTREKLEDIRARTKAGSTGRKMADVCLELLEKFQRPKGENLSGMIAQVEIPDDDVMLDEQKSLLEQPQAVQSALEKLGIDKAMFTDSNGRGIYESLSAKLGSPRVASEALNNAGIKGIRYNGHSDGECFVVFDDKAVSIIDRYNQAMQANAAVRGTTTVMQNGQRIVSLTQNADESTYMHEMAHIFLMDLGDLAQLDETSAKELEVVDKWAEWHRGDAKLYKGSPWAAEFKAREKSIIAAEDAGDFDEADRLKAQWRQERFARAFEQYLRDGQAPAKGLRAVFRKFKQFLRQIYQAVIADGTKASEPVRRVMDRMIATEDEITEMELDDRYKDVTKAGGEKLFDESEQDTYKRWQKEAAEEAKEKLMQELMKDLNEKVEEEFNERAAKEEEAYRRELMNEPVYLATQAAVASGNPETVLGWFPTIEEYTKAAEAAPSFEDALKEHMDKYKDALEAELIRTHLSEENVAHIMESTLYRAKLESLKATAFAKKQRLINTITAKAERAMSSVEEKITALPEHTDLKVDRFDKSVKGVMKEINRLRFSARWSTADIERIEDMLHAATKEELAERLAAFKAAVQNDKANEKAVEHANEGRMLAYKDIAKKTLSGKPLHEACDYYTYIREAKKAAKRVQQMTKAKRWDMAIIAQQQQAMSMALAEESRRLRQYVDKLTGKVKRQLQARTVRLPKDERYWHRHLAYLLRITNTDAQKPASGCAKLDELFSAMTESLDMQEGFSPTDILEMANEQGADFKGWQSLTMDQFEDAVNAMNILYTTGKNKFNMVTIGGKAIADVVDEIIHDDSEASRVGVQRRVINEDIGGLGYNEWLAKLPGGEAAARMGVKALSAITKPEEILRALGSKAHKYIYGIYERAREQEGKRIADEMAALQKILAPYSHKERQAWKKRNIRLNDQQGMLSKENIICMALNLGNATNRQRLAGGFQMTEQDIVDFVEKHMTAKDWQLVQDIWDHLNTYWQDTVAVEEKLNGMAIRKVEAVPFTVKASDTGEQIRLKGGYYPIAYNPVKSSKAAENAENALARGNMSGAMVLGTNRGFTKSRAEVDIEGRPLLLEFSVVPDHLQAVIHNITFRLAARDVYRLINNKDFEAHVADTLGSEYHAILKEWATDVWNITGNNNVAENVIGKVFNWLRANSTMSIMGYRIWPVVENISNIAPVIDKLGAADTMAAIADFYTNTDAAKRVLAKSVFMQNRINSLDRDIRQQPGLFNATYRPIEIIRDHAYDLMLYSDLMLSGPLWVRSYKNAFGEKLAEVRMENEANLKAVQMAQDKVDGIKARLIDLDNGILPPEAAGSPFDITNMTEAEGMDYLDRQQKDLEKDLFKAEQEFQQATELPIYTDAEIISEAERRAVFAADGAVRDTFGSGATMDQSSIQRTRNAAIKLMTTFYSFFNTQFNAILASYRYAKFSEGSYITRWAPFARSMMLRLVLMALIGSTMKFAFGLEGSGDDDKWKREKGSDGKETKVAVLWQERFLKVFGNNAMSQTFGAFPLVRDFANLMASYLFNGTTYGKSSADFFSVGMRGFTEGWRAVTMLAKKSEQNLELQEQEAKREQAWQERLKKLKGKKRAEAIRKHEEDKKYEHPQKPITYSEIARHGARALSSFTAAGTGITSTMVDAITGTMQYLNDSTDRYDKDWTNMVWSALWDKNPVEREIPQKPPAEPKPTKGKKKSRQK